MTPELFISIALVPALRLLPPRMDSPAARAMVVAICLQESRLTHRRQIRGPARGFAQFEKGGGVKGVLTHRATSVHITTVCEALSYKPTVAACYVAIEHNDVLAAVFARLLLWTVPGVLPGRSEPAKGWDQYLAGWRPGKAHPKTWNENYARAWALVSQAG